MTDFFFSRRQSERISLSDEDDYREHELCDVFRKIARFDILQTLEIWRWVLDEFLPHMNGIEDKNLWCCTLSVLNSLDEYPREFVPAMKKYVVENEPFAKALLTSVTSVPADFSRWVVDSLRDGHAQEAVALLTPVTENPHFDSDDMERLLVDILGQCKLYMDIEAVECFRDNLFPIFMNHADVPMQRRRKEWDEEIDGFITYEEEHNEKYQYSRRNLWRLQYKDERPDPRRYHSEEEYLAAREEQQNRWKSRYRNTNLYGLDIDQYVDETEFLSAYRLARQAHLEEEKEEQYSAEAKAKNEIAEKLLGGIGDIAIYEYCQILLPSSNTAYSYLTGGISLEIGDCVIVPVGSRNREMTGVVASVEKHTELTAPYPLDKTKKILRKEVSSNMAMKQYNFYGWETANAQPISAEYSNISSPTALYDILSEIWSADTCAPRLREEWSRENKTLGQCSITAFLAQDIFGGKVYGILRPGGNYHCYNVVDSCCFDLTSEQFSDEAKDLVYENNPEQYREIHFAKEEKRHRYELLKSQLKKWCDQK